MLVQIDTLQLYRPGHRRTQQGVADLRHIGQQLGAGSIVQGSVRMAGNTVRVTAQLSNASDGYNRWSQSWDRELSDIFAIQDEIANSVVAVLQDTLLSGPKHVPARQETPDIEVYTEYLRGQWLMRQPDLESLRQSMDRFRAAIDLDPSFSLPYVGLAYAQLGLFEWNVTGDIEYCAQQISRISGDIFPE